MKTMLAVAALGVALAAHAATPKVMVVVDEKALGSISTSEVETLAVGLLSAAGVETVDQSMVQANLERVQKAFRGAGDNRAAAVMGREFGADVMLIGKALAGLPCGSPGERAPSAWLLRRASSPLSFEKHILL